MFCKHKYEKISETTLPSVYEQLGERGKSLKTCDIRMFKKKYILVLQCSKCGKVKKITEYIDYDIDYE